MNKEDSLQFVQERLRQHSQQSPLTRSMGRVKRPTVTRRIAVELSQGEAQNFDCVDGSLRVHCASGSVWITHDGDCKDVILSGHQSHQADCDKPMHVYALEPTVLEIEFEDEATPG